MADVRHSDGDVAQIALHLLDAVRKTQESLRCVEIWASALTAFSQPVPEYRPDMTYVLRPGSGSETGGCSAGAKKHSGTVRSTNAPRRHSS